MVDFQKLPSPCFVLDETLLDANLAKIDSVRAATGAEIIVALKACAMWRIFPELARHSDGATASSAAEARLVFEEYGRPAHTYAPVYTDRDIGEILRCSDHITFNSVAQFERFGPMALLRGISCGLRINPQYSPVETDLYNPCVPGSRLGVTAEQLAAHGGLPAGVEGLHFHVLCESRPEHLQKALEAVETHFGAYLDRIKWLNMGGGHHITRPDYDIARLERCILHIKETYGVQVYLEPGEAIALNAGYLVTEVMDIVKNGISTLVLDASAACHMPDVLEMPYRPPLKDSGKPGEKAYTYRLSSCTCLAGDVIGDYSFDHEIHVGDKLYFEDMAIYSMVKNNTFNGMALPAIAVMEEDGNCKVIREFGYEDFKGRLA